MKNTQRFADLQDKHLKSRKKNCNITLQSMRVLICSIKFEQGKNYNDLAFVMIHDQFCQVKKRQQN